MTRSRKNRAVSIPSKSPAKLLHKPFCWIYRQWSRYVLLIEPIGWAHRLSVYIRSNDYHCKRTIKLANGAATFDAGFTRWQTCAHVCRPSYIASALKTYVLSRSKGRPSNASWASYSQRFARFSSKVVTCGGSPRLAHKIQSPSSNRENIAAR